MSEQFVAPLQETLRPKPAELDLEGFGDAIGIAESELRAHATNDQDRCCGYFPALTGMRAIRSELPACRAFAEALPTIAHAGVTYGFNFMRLSLVPQSADPAFHLDSDAATALTGDVATLSERAILRLLLNLSTEHERLLCFLDVDSRNTDLAAEGSYIRVKDPEKLQARRRIAVVPPRTRTTVYGLAFASNRVLHSGLDGEHGHFIAAYGVERADPRVAG